MYNRTDEIILELLRIAPRRKMELEQEVPASNVYHRCLRLMAEGRIVAIRPTGHMETTYALSEAEKENTDAQTSAKVSPHSEEHNVL
jgi:hypothetical protein